MDPSRAGAARRSAPATGSSTSTARTGPSCAWHPTACGTDIRSSARFQWLTRWSLEMINVGSGEPSMMLDSFFSFSRSDCSDRRLWTLSSQISPVMPPRNNTHRTTAPIMCCHTAASASAYARLIGMAASSIDTSLADRPKPAVAPYRSKIDAGASSGRPWHRRHPSLNRRGIACVKYRSPPLKNASTPDHDSASGFSSKNRIISCSAGVARLTELRGFAEGKRAMLSGNSF